MNSELFKLYKNEMERLKRVDIPSSDFDGPLLMNCWEDEYLNSKYKILFFGRESNGWMGDLVLDAKKGMDRYIDFALCNNNGNYTTFWQYIYETKNILMPESLGQKNFLWSNVSKFSTSEGKAINFEDFKFMCDNFNVLQLEIEIAKPDIIIFFTGESWDEKIQYQIKEKIIFEKLDNNIEEAELSRLIAKPFPFHTYRVEHPITLQTQRKWDYVKLIIENIKRQTSNPNP